MDKQTPSGVRFGVAGLLAAVACVAVLAWLSTRPANAQGPQFSAQRALPHLTRLAQAPRPIATAANAGARRYIIERLRAMGLEPTVQTATVQQSSVDDVGNVRVTLGVVHNILVRKAGAAPRDARRPALLLATHYDSGGQTPGASPAAGVAALLETLRVMQAEAPRGNDLIALFADGEEVGALGTQAFAEQHPWARQIGLVLKFDSNGPRGPLLLLGSHGASGAALRGWTGVAGRTPVSSFMQLVYPLHPGAPAMGPLRNVGQAGLHFANMEGSTGRDGALDTAGRFDLRTLQHTGDSMLALARHFGNAALARQARVYFDLPGLGLVHYSTDTMWVMTRLICLVFIGVCCLALRHHDAEPGDIARGALSYAAISVALALGAWLLWQVLPLVHPGYVPRMVGAGPYGHWYLLGFAALASGLFIYLQRGFQRTVPASAAALGALLDLVVLLLLASWLMPGASYVLTWPLLASLLAYGTLYLPAVRTTRHWRLPILLAGFLPGLILIVPLISEIFRVLTPDRMALPIALLVVLLGMGSTLLSSIRGRFMVHGLGIASVACVALASRAGPPAPPSVPAPQPNPLVYYKDTSTWKAYWMMPAKALDSWTRQFFPLEPNLPIPIDLTAYSRSDYLIARAPSSEVEFPYIEVLKYEQGKDRHIEFMLQSKNAAPVITVTQYGPHLSRAELNGRVLTDQRSTTWKLTLYGMQRERLHFKFNLELDNIAALSIEERIPGLPALDLPPRPAGLQPPLTPLTATTIAADSLLFR